MKSETPSRKLVRLKDVCREITVGHVGPMATEYVPEGVPFLRSLNITPYSIRTESLKYISEDFHRKLKKSALAPGDVVVVRTGNPGTACVVPANFPRANCADLVIFRPHEGIDPHYLAFIFNSVWGQDHVSGRLVGVAQQHFNIGVAKEVEVSLPAIQEQRRIASVLCAYQDLLANNVRRVTVLEEMARTIYQQWFVEFRFPGHEKVQKVASGDREIPAGWEIKPTADAFDFCGGATPSTKEFKYWDRGTVAWYSPSDLTKAGTMFISDGEKRITEAGLGACSARLFPAYSVMMTSRATLGVLAINTTEACTNQGFITCIPNSRLTCPHLYLWLDASRVELEQLGTGATFKEITKGAFRKFPILVAPEEIEGAFNSLVWPIFQLIENLVAKNLNLRETRDLLLPKLVSGEIDVSTFESAIPDAVLS